MMELFQAKDGHRQGQGLRVANNCKIGRQAGI